MEEIEKQKIPEVDFDYVIVAKNDKIVPSANQLRFWQGKNIKMINGNHFALYQFATIADIFEL